MPHAPRGRPRLPKIHALLRQRVPSGRSAEGLQREHHDDERQHALTSGSGARVSIRPIGIPAKWPVDEGAALSMDLPPILHDDDRGDADGDERGNRDRHRNRHDDASSGTATSARRTQGRAHECRRE